MNKEEYIKRVNKNLLSCWLIIDVVLLCAYIGELIKGLRNIEYIILFNIFTFTPFLIAYIFNKITKGYSENLKYIAGCGYCVFYTFVLFTTNSPAAFVYIIPMMSVLIVYTDKILIILTYGYSLIINIIYILLKIQKGSTPEEITFFEIQIACIVLSSIFLLKTAKLINQGNKKLFKLSEDIFKDTLTNSYNRSFFTENIDKIFKTGKNNKGLSLAFIDIDNFKRFNTNHGHNFGDDVLQQLCSVVNDKINIYNNTYLIRMGGDEFIIISNDLDKNSFFKLMNEINKEIYKLELKKDIFITISIGVANSKADKCDDYLELYNLADKRLYEAKEKGKNQVII